MVRAFKALVRGLLKPVLSPRVPVRWQRRLGSLIGLSLRGPAGAVYRERRWAGVPVLDIAPAVGTPTLGGLFLHGGGYVIGGFGSRRRLAAAVGEAAGEAVVLASTHNLLHACLLRVRGSRGFRVEGRVGVRVADRVGVRVGDRVGVGVGV